MFTIRIDHDLDKIAKQFGMLAQGRVPAAASRAINVTARLVKEAEEKEMRDVFDRPTPWTLNSVFIKAATERDLSAVVWLKDERATSRGGIPASRYLEAEIAGGSRHMKAFEVRLRNAGIMPDGYRAVPGAGADIDSYGNLSRGQIIQILSFFQTANIHGDYSNMNARGLTIHPPKGSKKSGVRGFVYFALQKRMGKLLPGIYKRFEFAASGTRKASTKVSAVKPIVIFVPHAVYKAVFDFKYVADKVVERNLPELMHQAMVQELELASK